MCLVILISQQTVLQMKLVKKTGHDLSAFLVLLMCLGRCAKSFWKENSLTTFHDRC